jgi:NitT/TauT family transport system substrate-binding protein
MNSRTLRACAVVLLVAAGALAAWYGWRSWGGKPAPAVSGPAQRVIFATNTDYIGSCSIFAAQARGFFAEQGIAAVITSHSSGKSAMEAMLGGKADLATVAELQVMFSGLAERPVAVVATLFRGEKDHGIVGRRDRGIDDPASLKGKHIGVALNTSAHFALEAFLNRQLLAPQDVTLHNYPTDQLAAALARGDIDAAASWEPFLDTMRTSLAGNGVGFNSQDIYEINFNLVTTRSFLAGQRRTLERVLRALDQGERFCAQSPALARALLPPSVRAQSSRPDTPWPALRFKLTLDQGLILAMEDEARWAIRHRMTERSGPPNYLDYIYIDGLDAVAPAAVTLIH